MPGSGRCKQAKTKVMNVTLIELSTEKITLQSLEYEAENPLDAVLWGFKTAEYFEFSDFMLALDFEGNEHFIN